MLPGSRKFPDEDVAEIVGDALSAFGLIVETYGPMDDLRVPIFNACLNMAAAREVPIAVEGLTALGASGRIG